MNKNIEQFSPQAIHFFLLCVFTCLVFTDPARATVPKGLTDFGPVSHDNARNWTLMVYLDGDNDLEKFAMLDLNEMELGLPEKGVTVVALVDRAEGYDNSFDDWEGARVYELVHDKNPKKISSRLIADLGEINIGDPDILSTFIRSSARKFPARRYGVILWNHGGGWSLMAVDHNAPESPNKTDSLNLPEVRTAIQSALNDIGRSKIDLIGFDMCLMAQVETAYELSGIADLMVASQAVEPGDGWPYDLFLPMFGKESSGGGRRLAANIVKAYEKFYSERKEPVATLSAIDLNEIGNVVKAMDGISGKLTKGLDQYWSDTSRALFYSESYGDRTDIRRDFKVLSSIDLLDTFRRMRHQIPSFPAENEYNQLIDAMDRAILANYNSPRHHLSNGLAVYGPVTARQFSNGYQQLRLAKETGWAQFLNRIHDAQSKHLSKPEIKNVMAVDSQTGKPVTGGVPGGGFKVKATVHGKNVLWVNSIHAKRVTNNGGGIIFLEKGFVLDPEFYKKKEDAVASVIDLIMPEFKGSINEVSQEYLGRHFWVTNGKKASRTTVDATNLDDLRHVSVPAMISRKGLGQHFAKVYFDVTTWNAVGARWQISQPDGSVAYRSIPPEPEDEVTLLYEFIPDTPSDVSFLKSETLLWRNGLELIIGDDPPEDILVGMQAESIGGRSDFAVTKINVKGYSKEQQAFVDNAKKVSEKNLIGKWRWYGMTKGADQGWQPLSTYTEIKRSEKNKDILVGKIVNPDDPGWKVVPQMVLLDTRLVPTLRMISFDDEGNPEESMNFTFLVSRWENGSPRMILKYLVPKGWLIMWVKEGQGQAGAGQPPQPQPQPQAPQQYQQQPQYQQQAPQQPQQQQPQYQQPQQQAPPPQPPQGGNINLNGTWLGIEGDIIQIFGNQYQISEYGTAVDMGFLQIQGNMLVIQSQVTGMTEGFMFQLRGNTLFLQDRYTGETYQYQRTQ